MTRHPAKGRVLWSLTVLLLLFSALAPSPAAAHGTAGMGGMFKGFSPADRIILSPGMTLGGGVPTDGERSGFVLGGELSLLCFGSSKNVIWGGAYVDGLYGWERHGGRLSAGGVIGYWFAGVDAGYLVDFSRGGPHHGFSVRLFAAAGIVTLYTRYGYLHGASDFVEVGVLLKFPFSILRKDRDGWKPHVRAFANY